MNDQPSEHDGEPDMEVVRKDRLSSLSAASLRINESLDFETVLQGVLDSARSLTSARYGVMTLLDDQGRVQDFLSSGLTDEESGQLWLMPEGLRIFQALIGVSEPVRLPDLAEHVRSLGFPDFTIPLPVGVFRFMAAPMFHRDQRVGHVFVGDREDGEEFNGEDQEMLVMFAAQAALVIANARAYREERRARADLETLIDTSPVGVVVFDALTGTPVSVNREARRIVDGLWSPGQSPGQLLEVVSFKRADGREVSLEEFPLAQVLSTGETVRAEEIVIQVPDGRSVTTLVNATPVLSELGAVETVIVTIQDMTPLEELERLRAEFLGMVSHELRVPLTSIKGSVAALLNADSALDPVEARQFHRIIEQQADSIQDLIGDLLDVARVETGTLPVFPEPAEVVLLLERARSAFQGGGARHNLVIDLEPDLPLVMADRRRIVQVIGNLLSNAARHSPDWSTVRVSAVREDPYVAFSVADEGRGFAADILPYLFSKFTRTGDDGGPQTTGPGLGLAICKGIVEAHGGRIRAESAGPGTGARFTFTVPVVHEALVEPSRQLPVPASRREQVPILVVDDDPQTLRYARDTLTEAGYFPLLTADPAEALALMKENRPGLVLLDLVLPDSDGIELMRDILAIGDVPVIFLSVYGKDQVIARAFEMGAADYIVKPFTPTELVARIKAAMRRRDLPYRSGLAEPYTLGDLTIDYAERRVTIAGRPVELTPTEYDLLVELSIHGGRVVPHEHLLLRVWGPQNSGSLRTLRTHLVRLRRKLGDDAEKPKYILAEPRVGYRMPRSERESP